MTWFAMAFFHKPNVEVSGTEPAGEKSARPPVCALVARAELLYFRTSSSGNGATPARKALKAAAANGKDPEPNFQIGQKLMFSQQESFLWKSADCSPPHGPAERRCWGSDVYRASGVR
jgi:hypothetical protein